MEFLGDVYKIMGVQRRPCHHKAQPSTKDKLQKVGVWTLLPNKQAAPQRVSSSQRLFTPFVTSERGLVTLVTFEGCGALAQVPAPKRAAPVLGDPKPSHRYTHRQTTNAHHVLKKEKESKKKSAQVCNRGKRWE